MSGATPSADARLDAALARMPEPTLPPGLAARIVTQTTRLQQDPRREDVIVDITAITPTPDPTPAPSARPSGRSGSRMGYALAAFAVAASLAVVVAPRLAQQPGQEIATAQQRPAPKAAADAAQAQQLAAAPSIAPEARRRPDRPMPTSGPTAPVAADMVSPAAPPAAAEDEALASAEIETIPMPLAPAKTGEQIAEAAGPKRPVQGPPSPIFPNGSAIPTQGMSITGSGGVVPSAPAPGMGPGPGLGGGPAGPGGPR